MNTIQRQTVGLSNEPLLPLATRNCCAGIPRGSGEGFWMRCNLVLTQDLERQKRKPEMERATTVTPPFWPGVLALSAARLIPERSHYPVFLHAGNHGAARQA
jgi:hypothetical protein